MEKNLREGHRQRVRERFRTEGLDHFAPSGILEFILFYSVPRRDTLDLAHRLIDHFGSLAAVLEAPYEELMRIEGVTATTADLLTALPQLARRYLLDANSGKSALTTPQALKEYLIPYFCGRTEESVFLLCLDQARRPIVCKLLSKGDFDSVQIETRQIVAAALNHRAASVVLAHNHPHGITIPSRGDCTITIQLKKALAAVHIPLADHIIVARGQASSMAEGGYLIGS